MHVVFIILLVLIKVIGYVCKQTQHRERERRRGKRIRRERNDPYSYQDKPERKRGKKRFRLNKIAKRLDGRLDQSERKIEFQRRGKSYSLMIRQNYGASTFRLIGEWPSPKFRLRLFPDHHGQKKFQNMQDIEVGMDKFDRHFVVQSSNEDVARQILSPKVCRELTRHRKHAHNRITVNVAHGEIEFGGMANSILSVSQVVTIVKNFVDIHRSMMKFAGTVTELPDSSFEVKFIQRDISQCMVCGESVGDEANDGVACVQCDTVHHPDCWKYIGKCSTYGCRSRKSNPV